MTVLHKADTNNYFANFNRKRWCENLYETDWLTLSSDDLKAVESMFVKVVVIMMNFFSQAMRAAVTDLMRFVKKDFMLLPMFILMKMKKEITKTFNDNFLFLTAMLDDPLKEKAIRDILTVPVRSRQEAVLRWKQIIWANRETFYSVNLGRAKIPTITSNTRF